MTEETLRQRIIEIIELINGIESYNLQKFEATKALFLLTLDLQKLCTGSDK